MKMIKRTLIAIALLALLATSAHAALNITPLPFGDHHAIKVDGSDKVRWPWEYKALDICVIPIKMHVGMYAQVKDCKKKKLVLQQVDCGDIGEGADKYPCYLGCVSFDIRANFQVKMGANLEKVGPTIKDWDWYYDGDDVVPGDGDYHSVKCCVKAWKTQIYKAAPGDEVDVGKLHITVKPNA
ncbi:MAG TPA: hypothetical protein DIU00_11075 [Phycisphaerales bacterium]|nr:hypothetical protein [Phycisphaerales bacterium]